jgi:hypothetical protein
MIVKDTSHDWKRASINTGKEPAILSEILPLTFHSASIATNCCCSWNGVRLQGQTLQVPTRPTVPHAITSPMGVLALPLSAIWCFLSVFSSPYLIASPHAECMLQSSVWILYMCVVCYWQVLLGQKRQRVPFSRVIVLDHRCNIYVTGLASSHKDVWAISYQTAVYCLQVEKKTAAGLPSLSILPHRLHILR